jgi:hypothetical protein
MSGKKKFCGKCVRGILVGLVIAAVIVAICYYTQSHPSIDQGLSRLKELILPNRTSKANYEDNYRDRTSTSVKTTVAQLQELSEMIETYKNAIPEDVAKIVDNLISDHWSLRNKTSTP